MLDEPKRVANYKHWFIDCKGCGRRITLEIYTGAAIDRNRAAEKLRCPRCNQESTYSGNDFKTAELKASATHGMG